MVVRVGGDRATLLIHPLAEFELTGSVTTPKGVITARYTRR
ncbi:hypothetical protein [Nonomuraea montanisoli]|nr:hypothetical protein [Nonomuraea montanisoli]